MKSDANVKERHETLRFLIGIASILVICGMLYSCATHENQRVLCDGEWKRSSDTNTYTCTTVKKK